MDIRLLVYLWQGNGAGIYNAKLANSLLARGHRVSVVTFAPEPPLSPGIELTVLPPGRLAKTRLWRFADALNLVHGTRAIRCVSLQKPDVCIASEYDLILGHSTRFPDVPWMYLSHSRIHQEFISTSLDYTGIQLRTALFVSCCIEAWALKHATVTFRHSQAAADAMTRHFRLPSDHRFFIDPMAVDPPAVYHERSRGKPGRPLRFLSVATLDKRKNVALGLRALAHAGTARGWHYDVVGQGVEAAALGALAKELGIRDQITFHGFQSDVDRFYRDADVFLFPSVADNGPRVIVEAMSWGVPVIGFDDDAPGVALCNRATVSHGKDGLLARSEEDFETLVARVMRGEVDVAALGNAAHATVLERFTWDAHVDRFEKELELLVAERRTVRLLPGQRLWGGWAALISALCRFGRYPRRRNGHAARDNSERDRARAAIEPGNAIGAVKSFDQSCHVVGTIEHPRAKAT